MSDFWLNCDNCKRTEVGVTWVNGMRFCAKCYQETFGNTNPFEKELRDKIADLEAKLAEKEKEIEELKQRLKDTIKIYSDDFVEKDKELKELRFQARNIFPLVENLEDKVNQDKISFAVEQLEKVKELCKKKFDWWENSEWEGDIYDKSDVSNAYFDIEANIDNQIEELKKEMK